MHVTATAVLKWVRQYALENYEKPKPQTNTTATVVIELDEVWHNYLQRKKIGFGFGKHIVALPIGSLTGSVGIAIAGLFKGCFVGFSDGM